jgi:hypothetical protein
MTPFRSETETTIDWSAVDAAAERLGIHTRELVAARDAKTVRAWALKMHRDWDVDTSIANKARSASYLELAVLVGHVEPSKETTDADDAPVKARLPGTGPALILVDDKTPGEDDDISA